MLTIALCMLPVTFAEAQESQLRFGAGVPRDVEVIYERGLNWLAAGQNADGHWGQTAAGAGTQGIEGSGLTGLCLMAMLASGEDPNFGPYSQNIRQAVRSLIRGQSPRTGFLPSSMYHHGFGMLALAEVYGVLNEDSLWDDAAGAGNTTTQRSIGEALELAVRCAVTAQQRNPYKAWRYSPDARDADTSVTGAVLMGLLAARNAGVRVPDEAVDGALEYFLSMTSESGEVGYSGIGSGGSASLKAISGLVLAVGHRRDVAQYEAVLRQLTNNLEHTERAYPEYYRYYAAQTLFQADFDAWMTWNLKTLRDLRESQQDDGRFDSRFGPAYGTSMALLSLALNYRLLPIYER